MKISSRESLELYSLMNLPKIPPITPKAAENHCSRTAQGPSPPATQIYVCIFSMAHLAPRQQGSPSVTDSILTPKSKLPTVFLLQKKFADPCSRITITNGLS